jgi:hypothetical protein
MGTYLSIDCKFGIPGVWRDNLADTILSRLGRNLLHVGERVLPLFWRGPIGGCFLQSMGAHLLHLLSARRWLSPPLDAGQVER